MKLPCLHLSWPQDLAAQRINLGSSSWVLYISSHWHWDLLESTHRHLCPAATEALGSLVLYPSSWGSKTDQSFKDPAQRGKDFPWKHTFIIFGKHQWVLQRSVLASPFFPDHLFVAPDPSTELGYCQDSLFYSQEHGSLWKKKFIPGRSPLYVKLKGLVLF